jgi:hypothetical protein
LGIIKPKLFQFQKGTLTMARRLSHSSADQFEDRPTDQKSSQTSADELEDLRIIKRSEMLKAELLTDIMEENGSLCRIFTASLKTMRSDLQKRKMRNGKRQTENN